MERRNWLPTPEQQARIDEHWANVRAGMRADAPEPEYKTPQEVIEMHRFLAMEKIEQAAWHARQVIEHAEGEAA